MMKKRQDPAGPVSDGKLGPFSDEINTIVLVDLKIGAFEDRDVGQMNKYVTYYRERVPRYPWEKPPIGLIICAHASQETVRYALGGLEEKIFVAEYRLKLPSEARIQEGLGLLGPDADNPS